MSARILLAEDDNSLRLVLSQALGKEGYDVRATGNVATLSKWVREGEGDLVLSDVYMGDDCVFDALPAMRMARPHLFSLPAFPIDLLRPRFNCSFARAVVHVWIPALLARF